MSSSAEHLLILLMLSNVGWCLSFQVDGDLLMLYSPAVKQRLSEVSRFLLPVPDDTLVQTARRYIPVQAVSEECRNHSNYLLDSLLRGDIWALRMIDAASKPWPGVLDGHLYDLGNYRQCLDVKEPALLFSSQHCVVEINGLLPPRIAEYLHPGTIVPFPLDKVVFSVCVPSSCSQEDVTAHIDNIFVGINASASSFVYCSSSDPLPLRNKDYIAMSVFCAIALLIFAGAVCDLYGASSPVLSAFSPRGNFRNLMDTRKPDAELSCLNGLRVIFIVVVVLTHRFITTLQQLQFSTKELHKVVGSILPEIGELNKKVVDGFFLMSGTVLAYNFFRKNMDEYKFHVTRFYIDRYVRLTPLLACLILYYSTLLIHQSQGPIWSKVVITHMEQPCNELWWAGLLHISTYVNSSCVGHSWFVACNFQLYLISPLLLLPLLKRPKVGLLLLAATTLLSALAASAESYIYDLGTGGVVGVMLGERAIENLHHATYTYTHSRLPPFCIGIALGYLIFLVKTEKIKFNLSKTALICGWTASIGTYVSVLALTMALTNPHHEYSPWLDPFYIGFSRVLFSASISWIIFACFLGYGGLVDRFLSWPGFRPLGKLTFGVFMVHIIVVMNQMLSTQEPIVLSAADYLYMLGGDMILSFALAVVTHLTVEAPSCRLASYLLSG